MENKNQNLDKGPLTLDQLVKYGKEVLLPATLDQMIKYNQEVLLPAMDFKIESLKEDFATKKEFNEFKDKSLTNQDQILKKLDTKFQEDTMLSHKVDRHEKWFEKVAQKLDMKLEY